MIKFGNACFCYERARTGIFRFSIRKACKRDLYFGICIKYLNMRTKNEINSLKLFH